MKRNLFLILVVLFSTSLIKAQSVKGINFINGGVGVGTIGFTGTGGLPITASFEHGVSDKISAGAFLDLLSTSFGTDYRYSYYVIGVRGSYHFNEVLKISDPKVEIYGGASLFYRGLSIKFYGPGRGAPVSGSIDVGIHAGAHYYFASNVGGFAELGYGISALTLGLTFKF